MSNLAIVAGLLSVITTTVKQVEARSDAAKAAGEKVWTGEFKLALALSIIESAYNATKPTVQFTIIKDTVVSVVGTVVHVFNALGQFRKTAVAA